ncbi:hypothetical protein [Alkalilimnicola sp. S0819]|uniref:hypothetical protein n=1 Tax=Alkalilimnicola sp. S0819 TaxID=2613922 RepID=UPI0012628748|nr:hypothetical protein [Alkalilimnicola sp. S0819]KAB7623819.1 hypothetical protein F3N43_08590 [Alkalilimnicola sp. S0819]MPQ16693.1 hypothetical protein [Alkalilimnicola sp. S0819]
MPIRPTSPEVQTIPGVLLSLDGRGVLLTGESGVGKSETALQLIERGHRLVADDAVELYPAPGAPRGRSPEALRGLLEVRGLGLLEVTRLFGPGAWLAETSIALEIELLKASPADYADWPRLEPRHCERAYLGQSLPCLQLPVSPGRPLALLVETATRGLSPPTVRPLSC